MLSNDPPQGLLDTSLPFRGNVIVITQVLQRAVTLPWNAMAYRYDSHSSPRWLANTGLRPSHSIKILQQDSHRDLLEL